MNITIISAYFYPEITPRAFRTTELVMEFIRRGYNVTLYIPKRDYVYDEFIRQYPIVIKYFSDYQMASKKLPKGYSLVERGYRYLYYRFSHYTEYPQIQYVKDICKALKGTSHDVIISIAAPHCIHWGVARAIQENSKLCRRWIADCGDPFMGDQTQNHPFYFKRAEKQFCRYADYITIPIESAKDAYYAEFRDKLRVIPQGFDFSIKKSVQVKNSIPTFAYAGALYKGYRDLNNFVELLRKNYSDRAYKFIVYAQKSSLTESYKAILGDKIEIREYIPREELFDVLSKMDFLLNIENAGKVQSPSKLIDYYLIGRPILSVPREIREDIVDEFFNNDYKHALPLENMDQYNIVNVVNEFSQLF